jgi:segregation and condensation protein A
MSDVEHVDHPADRGAAGPTRTSGGASAGGQGVRVPESGARVCEIALEEFEGPLDLLLHLVRRHELDILDIPIAFVCEKYLEYIELLQALDLEVAGDYLVMAATLAYLKSRELVPQDDVVAEEGGEEGEGGADPRQQLILRLLEYQKYKEAADRLDARPIAGRDTFGRGGIVELTPLVDTGLAPVTLFRLAEAYQRVLDRARIHKSHEVVMETISVAARMDQLTTLLIERSRFDFEALFLERPWSSEAELRSMLVVTLMSVLELVRMGVASVHQPLGADTIVVERVASAEEAREALRGYDEAASFGVGPKPLPVEGDEDQVAEPGAEDQAESSEGPLELAVAAETDALGPDDEPSSDEALLDWQALLGGATDDADEDDAGEPEAAQAEQALPDDVLAEAAQVTEAASAGDETVEAATPGAASGGPALDDAGALARSVVSESPPSPGVVDDAAGGVASALPVDGGASESTDGDGQEHGENGKAQAVEGS